MRALIVPERAVGLGRMVEHRVVVVVTEEQECAVGVALVVSEDLEHPR